jgi:hypothetical protein
MQNVVGGAVARSPCRSMGVRLRSSVARECDDELTTSRQANGRKPTLCALLPEYASASMLT